MPIRPRAAALSFLVVICLPAVTSPDAVVVTKAMNATTIAEIFIDPKSIRVELEIGPDALPGFADLLPDALFVAFGNAPRPFQQRLQTFFQEGLTFEADGKRLEGRFVNLEVRTRIHRDVITGAPLPVSAEDAEEVLAVELAYRMPGRPKVLEIKPPLEDAPRLDTKIGFMAYHRNIPINDFRYLSQAETLRLDWEDPWFSRFDNPDLRRELDSPLSAFIYIEPYEVRQEIIIRPKDLQHWVELGLAEKEVITVAEQEAITKKAAEFLAANAPLTIDGQPVDGILDRAQFIYRNLRTSGVINPPRDLDPYAATLGVIFYYPRKGYPQEVAMKWELFNDRIRVVPAAATDEAGSRTYRVTPDDPVMTWMNRLESPTIPGLVDVANPPRIGPLGYGIASLVSLIGAMVALFRYRRSPGGHRPGLGLALMLLVLVAGALSIRASLSPSYLVPANADAVISALLENVYRAFDVRDESLIYDALSRSASGDLLTEIFLETRRGLELENQGGARAKVRDVRLVDAAHEALPGETGFISHCTWTVAGAVGHWGHTHMRENQYQARFVVRSIDGVWKITALELLQEERL